MLLTKRVDGQSFNIRIEGAGEPILFVHGFPLDQTMWTNQIDHFSKSLQVIAPDLRGFGESSPAEGTVEMKDFADDLSCILDALEVKEPVHFCGLSMGGYIAWEFIQRYPEKVKSLILCDTKASPDTEEAKASREQTAQQVLAKGPEFLATAMPEKLFSPHTIAENSDAVKQTQSLIRSTNPNSIAAALRGMAVRADMDANLKSIDVPTLVIVGEDDQLTTPDVMKEMAKAIPNAQFVEVQQAGHMSPLEQPEFVNQTIEDFLRSQA
ncbi:alpha/beta fold hydrolase [Thalassoglobus polymorphus]|uniref:3-oxoadipate enol-lactonase 2 n=1 Tax=Thalassoglobus polymorphus TaxID=2527994 RepID=A0A517QS44_9PLAN|nr:alpha/beta fold hydrolase [Thalassoglobus polymorphus]QDT34433.1 3-oxoadipate enol-lactonase 2 [Thalassoglobus polymorphus]